jgi:hypothetical protein
LSKSRDKSRDRRITRKLVRDVNRRTPYSGGENWLGHGRRGGKDARIDYLLLDGATMEQLLTLRNTESSVRAHLSHLKGEHGLPVPRGSGGIYRFDVAYPRVPPHTGISGAPDRNAEQLLPEEISHPGNLVEGSVCTITVNAYERNTEARKRCLKRYGYTCSVCGFDFERAYGSVGKGFIHVHHLRPLAKIGREYKVDPIKDLRPVCPNCHAIIHLKRKIRTIEQVQRLLRSGSA